MSQHGQEDLQLEAARRHRMNGTPKRRHGLAEHRLDPLALVLTDVTDPRRADDPGGAPAAHLRRRRFAGEHHPGRAPGPRLYRARWLLSGSPDRRQAVPEREAVL